VFGRTRSQRSVDADGRLRVSRRVLPQDQWEVLITGHHRGFIDWDTGNQLRIRANIRPAAHQPGTGAVREGCALLQGLATCGVCGRKLAVYYDGPAKSTPGYYCTGTGKLIEGRGARHLRVGGAGIDAAVAEAFLAALAPAALQACLTAAQQLEHGHHAALGQWHRQVERARYEPGRAERRYRAVDCDNRLVARGLETGWNTALQALADAEAKLARREAARPKTLTPQEKSAIPALGDDTHRGSACMLVDTWSSFAPRGAWFMVRVRGEVRPPAGGIDPGLHTLIWALDDEHSIAADLVDIGVAVTVCDAAVRREGNRECHTGSLP
jgi:hypothetical protein